MKQLMKTVKTMAIALIALAASAGAQNAQAQGELEYAENLFAIVWFERKPADKTPEHAFQLLHWNTTAYKNEFGATPIHARTAKGFNRDKEHVGTIYNGTVTLAKREIGNDKDYSVVFYLQMNIFLTTFYPERALKVEVFPNRRTAIITQEGTGFRRMVPVQRYATKDETSTTFEKEPRTAINFGPLK